MTQLFLPISGFISITRLGYAGELNNQLWTAHTKTVIHHKQTKGTDKN